MGTSSNSTDTILTGFLCAVTVSADKIDRVNAPLHRITLLNHHDPYFVEVPLVESSERSSIDLKLPTDIASTGGFVT